MKTHNISLQNCIATFTVECSKSHKGKPANQNPLKFWIACLSNHTLGHKKCVNVSSISRSPVNHVLYNHPCITSGLDHVRMPNAKDSIYPLQLILGSAWGSYMVGKIIYYLGTHNCS